MEKAKHLNLSFRAVPWPGPRDQLFKEDSNWWHNARLDLGGKGWGSYALGYKNAADLLARRFLEHWQGNDNLTYPMVFLYRHYLELRLKEVIIIGEKLLDKPLDIQQEILTDHHLEKLWKPCREILERLAENGFWPKDSKESGKLDCVGKLIKEFQDKDPKAISFRYPVTKTNTNGQPTLPHLKCVGVRNLYKRMQRLDSFFSAQIAGIDFHLQQKD